EPVAEAGQAERDPQLAERRDPQHGAQLVRRSVVDGDARPFLPTGYGLIFGSLGHAVSLGGGTAHAASPRRTGRNDHGSVVISVLPGEFAEENGNRLGNDPASRTAAPTTSAGRAAS